MYCFRNLFMTVSRGQQCFITGTIYQNLCFCITVYSTCHWSVKCTFYVGRIVNKSMASTSVYNIHITFFWNKNVESWCEIIILNSRKKLFLFIFLFSTSADPKGHVRYCHSLPVHVVICKLLHFNFLVWNHWANWNQAFLGCSHVFFAVNDELYYIK
jgi:hypothetical protein